MGEREREIDEDMHLSPGNVVFSPLKISALSASKGRASSAASSGQSTLKCKGDVLSASLV